MRYTMRKLNIVLLTGVLFAGGLAVSVFAQTEDFQLEPSGVQMELYPGHSSTTGFLIKAGSAGVLQNRLLLSLADWEFDKVGAVVYKEPGATKRSAASWLSIQPIVLPLAPGDVKLVRIAVRVPEDAAPGVYTSAVLVTGKAPELLGSTEVPGAPSKVYAAFTVLVTVRPPLPIRGADLTMIPR